MGAFGRYLKDQTQTKMYFLGHKNVTDFYISSWQSNFSAVPLLCLRTILFLGCVAILLSSFILTVVSGSMIAGHWFIYLTHWGLVLITFTTGFAFVVSLMAYLQGPLDAPLQLPWYVKTYWVLYNIGIPMAFLITGFYYLLLTGFDDPDGEGEYAVNNVLDIFIHAMNSVVMFILLLTSGHPSRLSHSIHPLLFGITYAIFSVIYYFAGGTNPMGTHTIYPMLDWANPGSTIGMVALVALVITIFHFLVVGVSLLRDCLAQRLFGFKTVSISNGV